MEEGSNEQQYPAPKPDAPPEPRFPLPVEEEERVAREQAAHEREESRQAMEQQKHALHERTDALVARGQAHKLPLSSLVPTTQYVRGVALVLVPALLGFVGSVVLVGGGDWVLGACLCGASALLLAVAVVWNRSWVRSRSGWHALGMRSLAVVALGGGVLVACGFHNSGGALLLSLIPLSYVLTPERAGEVAGGVMGPCAIGVAGWLVLDETSGVVVLAIFCALGGLILFFSFGKWLRESDAGLCTDFKRLHEEAQRQLDSVNLLVDQAKARIKTEEPGMADVVAIPNFVAGAHGAHVSQPLPLWWYFTTPIRVVGTAVGGLVFAVPDGLRAFDLNNPGWATHAATSVVYNWFVRPWIALLVARFGRDALVATPVLHSQLEFAQDHLGDGVEFVPVAVKRSARAMVKVRDDYLVERMPSFLLSAVAMQFLQGLVGFVMKPLGRGNNPCLQLIFAVFFLVPLTLPIMLLMTAVVLFAILERVPMAVVLYSWHVGPATAQLVDMARASLVCDTPHDLMRLHRHLHDHHRDVWEVVRAKNAWADDSVKGYAHIVYNVRMRDTGVVCEVQVTLREVFEWRKFTHLPYVVLRAGNWQALVQDVKGREKKGESKGV